MFVFLFLFGCLVIGLSCAMSGEDCAMTGGGMGGVVVAATCRRSFFLFCFCFHCLVLCVFCFETENPSTNFNYKKKIFLVFLIF